MPDWSYHPILRPWLFHLEPEQAQQIVLSVVGKVAERRLGGMMFHLFGHMTPPETIKQHVLGMALHSQSVLATGWM
jgi:dihydroorotate dehydrogenase